MILLDALCGPQYLHRSRRTVPFFPFSVMTSILVGSLAVAGVAFGTKAAIQAFSRYQARKSFDAAQFKNVPPREAALLHQYSSHGFQHKMTRDEAVLVLGLERNSPRERVKNAHRDLMLINHPDRGGSTYLSSKINEAKDMLMAENESRS